MMDRISVFDIVDSISFDVKEAVEKLNDAFNILKGEVSDMENAISIVGKNSTESLSLALNDFLRLRSSMALLRSYLDSVNRSIYLIDMLSRLDSALDEECLRIQKAKDDLFNIYAMLINDIESIVSEFEAIFSSAIENYEAAVFSYIDSLDKKLNTPRAGDASLPLFPN